MSVESEVEMLQREISKASYAAGSIEEVARLAPNLTLDRRQVLVKLAYSFRQLGDSVREEAELLLGRLAAVPCPSGEGSGSVGVEEGVAAHPETVEAPTESRSVDEVVRDQIRQLSEVRRALKAALR